MLLDGEEHCWEPFKLRALGETLSTRGTPNFVDEWLARLEGHVDEAVLAGTISGHGATVSAYGVMDGDGVSRYFS